MRLLYQNENMQVFESDIPLQELKQSSLFHTDSIQTNTEQTDCRELCGAIKPNTVSISILEWDSKDDTSHNSK